MIVRKKPQLKFFAFLLKIQDMNSFNFTANFGIEEACRLH
jgi:hypothetical protein